MKVKLDLNDEEILILAKENDMSIEEVEEYHDKIGIAYKQAEGTDYYDVDYGDGVILTVMEENLIEQ